MPATEYTTAAMTASERLGNRPDECGCCTRAGLLHIVKLRHASGSVVWMGTGCAAVALYGDRKATTKVAKAISATEHAAKVAEDLRTERQARYAGALAAFTAGDDAAVLASGTRKTYHSVGCRKVTGLTFPEFLAEVAASGELPAAHACTCFG